MGGTLRGKFECFINTGTSANTHADYFKNIYDAFVAHPNMTQIARNNGSGGTGVGYFDSATPFGDNAWFVFKMGTSTARTWPYYILVQLNKSSTFGASPGNPGLCDTAGGVSSGFFMGIQAAIGIGGDENPWNGAGTIGSSTKGATVWKIPTGGTQVMVFPRSNNPGGTHNSLKENCSSIFPNRFANAEPWDSPTRQTIIMDDDNLIILTDPYNRDEWFCTYLGLFNKASGMTLKYNLCQISEGFNTFGGHYLPWQGGTGNIFGIDTGSPSYSGGIVTASNDTDYQVKGLVIGRYDEFLTSNMQPNRYFNPIAQFDEFPVHIMSYEGFGGSTTSGVSLHPNGRAGTLPLLRETFGIQTCSTSLDGYTAYFGTSVIQSIKLAIPWSPSIVPKSGTTRAGTSLTGTDGYFY